MLKPLLIDFDYQILNSATGQIARNFWEHQSDVDFQPTIVCTPANFDFKSKWPTIEVKDRHWLWLFGSIFRRLGLPDMESLPDMNYYSWAKFVNKRLRSLIKDLDFDYIHTICAPRSTHLIGLELKRITGKPWVAQFNDPWHDDKDHVYRTKHFSDIDLKFERSVVENADLITHTNHILADIFRERYGCMTDGKMFVMPLNFNIASMPDVKESLFISNPDKIIISHIGEIYGTRSSVDFLQGVSILVEKKPEFRDRIKIFFVGGVKKEEENVAESLNIQDIVSYTPKLPPEDLKEYYSNSSIFLAIDVNVIRSSSFPSKLMMYFYYRKPILGITNPGSIMDEELKRAGHIVCYYGYPEQIADCLYNAINNYGSLNGFDKDYWKRYRVDSVLFEYKKLLNKIGIK